MERHSNVHQTIVSSAKTGRVVLDETRSVMVWTTAEMAAMSYSVSTTCLDATPATIDQRTTCISSDSVVISGLHHYLPPSLHFVSNVV